MAMEPDEGGGVPQQRTDYSAQSDPGAKPGFVLSAWSLVVGGVFIILVLAGLLYI